MRTPPSPLATLRAVFMGYLPRLVQLRGWVVAGLPLLVALGGLGVSILLRLQGGTMGTDATLVLYHQGLASVMVPIMALVAAPAGLREDLEQRVLPLLLVRPLPVWTLPFARGAGWFLWGGLWLGVACLALVPLGLELSVLPLHLLALLLAFWAELAFLTLLGLLFRRGTLWGVLALFLWDPLVRILPGRLQWFTFIHHVESLTGTRSLQVRAHELLAQPPMDTAAWASALTLLVLGLVCWAAAGWKLQGTPIGLSGVEGEG